MTKLQKERHAEGSAADGAAGVVVSANGLGEDAVATNYPKLAAGTFIALASYFGLCFVARSEPETATAVLVVMLVIPYCIGIWLMCRACRRARWCFIILGGIALLLVAWKYLLWAAPAFGSDDNDSGTDAGDASSDGDSSGSSGAHGPTASHSSDYIFLDLNRVDAAPDADTSWTCARCGGIMRSPNGKCTSCSLTA